MNNHKDIDTINAEWDAFDRPKPGDKFLHYKGDLYSIVETGFLEDSETPCVIYRSQKQNTVWVRTAKNFFELVEYNGRETPRFQRVK